MPFGAIRFVDGFSLYASWPYHTLNLAVKIYCSKHSVVSSLGDCEKEIGLKVSFDRHTTNMAKAQSGFFEFVGDPLFTLWDQFVSSPLSKQLCRNLDNNKACWDEIFAQVEEQELECHAEGVDFGDDNVIEDLEMDSEIHSDSSTD